MFERLRIWLFRPVDVASLVFFRIAFGVVMVIEVWRYFTKGWIPRYYIDPDFHFKYLGFEWLAPWSGDGMYWHFAMLGLLAACIAVGAFYRIASVLFLLGFSYVFLLDQTQYLNHFYLVILISFLMCFLPAHCAFSVDAWRLPRIKSRTIPAWAVWTLVIQFEIMYLYAGIAKINPDWLQLEPLGMWLNRRDHLPLIGPYFSQPWVIAIGAYGVILLHLVGAPLLLWRRTRIYVFLIYACFHLMNHMIFKIGIFPWFTLAGTLVFFAPDWPRRVARWLLRLLCRLGGVEESAAFTSAVIGARTVGTAAFRTPLGVGQRMIMASMTVWFALQIALPLRHFVYPGDVAWNEDGHRFAWRMKLRDKKGVAEFIVRDPRYGKEWVVEPSEYLNRRQARKMRTRPDMILQFAYYLEQIFREEKGIPEAEVRADVWVALNGRRSVQFVDREKDLTKIDRRVPNAEWILPLTEPLPKERQWAKN